MSQSTEQHPIAYVERPRVALADPNIDKDITLVMQRLHSHGWMVGNDDKARPPTAAEAATVAYIATQYGLDPLLGEILLLGSKIYIPLKALERKAREAKAVKAQSVRPATRDERESARVDDHEEYWIASITSSDGIVYDGHGFASPENVAIARRRDAPPDRRILRNVAEKRALERAYRRIVNMSDEDSDFQVVPPPALADKGADKSAALAQAAAAFAPRTAALPEPPVQVVDAPQVHAETAPVRETARPVAAQQEWQQTLSDEEIRTLQKRIDLLLRRGVPESAIYEAFVRLGADKHAWVVSLPRDRFLDAKVELQSLANMGGAA